MRIQLHRWSGGGWQEASWGEQAAKQEILKEHSLSLSLSTPPHLPYHRLHGVLDLAEQGKEFNEQLAPSMVQSLLFSILGMCC